MQRAAIIVKDPQQQFEALRTSLGLLMAGMQVQMFMLQHEIKNMNEAFIKRMVRLDDSGGQRFSDNLENARKYGFTPITMARAADQIRQADIIIPF
jgi:hypothetical protein